MPQAALFDDIDIAAGQALAQPGRDVGLEQVVHRKQQCQPLRGGGLVMGGLPFTQQEQFGQIEQAAPA
jgi:hypothetical protein